MKTLTFQAANLLLLGLMIAAVAWGSWTLHSDRDRVPRYPDYEESLRSSFAVGVDRPRALRRAKFFEGSPGIRLQASESGDLYGAIEVSVFELPSGHVPGSIVVRLPRHTEILDFKPSDLTEISGTDGEYPTFVSSWQMSEWKNKVGHYVGLKLPDAIEGHLSAGAANATAYVTFRVRKFNGLQQINRSSWRLRCLYVRLPEDKMRSIPQVRPSLVLAPRGREEGDHDLRWESFSPDDDPELTTGKFRGWLTGGAKGVADYEATLVNVGRKASTDLSKNLLWVAAGFLLGALQQFLYASARKSSKTEQPGRATHAGTAVSGPLRRLLGGRRRRPADDRDERDGS